MSFLIRHARQVEEVKTKGYFMTDDGQKSTDVIVKKKVKKGQAMVPKVKTGIVARRPSTPTKSPARPRRLPLPAIARSSTSTRL